MRGSRDAAPYRGWKTPPVGSPVVAGLPAESSDDIDSEPRPKWTPNPVLLQALADARADLKPGESSLFWDWTGTRESAPPAEDVRPSDHGELLISDKEAAATYLAPVEVAPARAPRLPTKSRVRVREDVDPRRQPTVRKARSEQGDPDAASGVRECPPPPGSGEICKTVQSIRGTALAEVIASCSAAASPAPSAVRVDRASKRGRDRAHSSAHDRPHGGAQEIAREGRASDRSVQAHAPIEAPMSGRERRRRIAWAIFFGVFTGTIVFFWLRLPRDLGRFGQGQPTTKAEAPAAPPPARASSSVGLVVPNAIEEPAPAIEARPPRATPPVTATARPARAKAPLPAVTVEPAADIAAPAAAAEIASAPAAPTAGTVTATVPAATVTATATAPVPTSATAPSESGASSAPPPAHERFLIRRKGSN